MGTVLEMKKAPAARRSRMDTLLITQEDLSNWRLPPFQRPLHVNEKVRQLAAEIHADGGVIPGVLTIGHLDGQSTCYIIDGQHRLEAFRLSEIKEAIADVRFLTYSSMAEMGEAFVELNSRLVSIRPDDVLRGLEGSIEALGQIRGKCSFVGYGTIKRNGSSSTVLSMSAVLRAWHGSDNQTPTLHGSAAIIANEISPVETARLINFLTMAYEAWGRGNDVSRLWGGLNLSILMWLWRRVVLDDDRDGVKRAIVLKPGQFKNCLMALGATSDYSDWLVGRNVGDRDRGPAYARIKQIFTKRLKDVDGIKVVKLPNPAWDNSR
jgi:hypothetical protein